MYNCRDNDHENDQCTLTSYNLIIAFFTIADSAVGMLDSLFACNLMQLEICEWRPRRKCATKSSSSSLRRTAGAQIEPFLDVFGSISCGTSF